MILSRCLGWPDRWLLKLAGLVPRHSLLSYDDYLSTLKFYIQDDIASELMALPDRPAEFIFVDRKLNTDGQRVHLVYLSRYEPHHSMVAEAFNKYPKNMTGHFFLWQPDDKQDENKDDKKDDRPLVICIHGFLMGDVGLAEKMFRISRLVSKGVDVGLFVLPHHGERTSHTINQRMINPDNLPLTIETIAQAIHDLRSVHLGVKAMGYKRVGIIAASLGGYCGALYATLVNDFDFLFTVVPALDLHTGLQPQKKYLGFAPTAELMDLSARVLDIITPEKRKPQLAPERIAVVYHDADQLNPPEHARHWIRNWGIQTVHAIRGGHWLYLDRQARGRAWYGWLAKHGYI